MIAVYCSSASSSGENVSVTKLDRHLARCYEENQAKQLPATESRERKEYINVASCTATQILIHVIDLSALVGTTGHHLLALGVY